MKTTVELPDDLFVEAKAVAARRRISLKTLFSRALERELHPLKTEPAGGHFEIDGDGWPVLRRAAEGDIPVRDAWVNELRAAEGI